MSFEVQLILSLVLILLGAVPLFLVALNKWRGKKLLAIGLGVLLMAAGFLMIFVFPPAEDTVHISMREVFYDADTGKLKNPGEGFLAGNGVICFNVDSKAFSNTYAPDDRRAETADDVGYIVRFRNYDMRMGQYRGGGNASKRYCDVELLHVQSWIVVAKHTFEGSDPPESIRENQKGATGGAPSAKTIKAWVSQQIAQREG